MILTVVLGISNCFMYPFWSVHERLVDFYKYYLFQTLSARLARQRGRVLPTVVIAFLSISCVWPQPAHRPL